MSDDTSPNRAKAQRLAYSSGALLTINDLAEKFRIGRSTAFRMLATGKLPAPDVRIGKRVLRWKPSTVTQFIDRGGSP